MSNQPPQNNVIELAPQRMEFQEIAHAGGKIEFVREGDEITGIKVSINRSAFQLLATPNGKIRNIVQSLGYMPDGPPPDPLIQVWMISDIEGLYGRTCPECKSYFRTNCVTENTCCPYCSHWDTCIVFTTRNQQEFITQYCNLFIKSYEEQKELIVDLNEITLAHNKPSWLYSEEQQQNRFDCKNCRTTVDVLGDYAGCPKCGTRNYEEIIKAKLDELERQFKTADVNLTDRYDREIEWEKLLRCVSEFEAMANDLRKMLMRLPATPQRKADLNKLSFQRIINASEALNNWFGFEILKDISTQDREFMNKMFNRRHVFTHNAGKVDQEYLNNTGDSSVRLNEVIRLRSNEVKRLIPLIRQIANSLITGFKSIS